MLTCVHDLVPHVLGDLLGLEERVKLVDILVDLLEVVVKARLGLHVQRAHAFLAPILDSHETRPGVRLDLVGHVLERTVLLDHHLGLESIEMLVDELDRPKLELVIGVGVLLEAFASGLGSIEQVNQTCQLEVLHARVLMNLAAELARCLRAFSFFGVSRTNTIPARQQDRLFKQTLTQVALKYAHDFCSRGAPDEARLCASNIYLYKYI